MNDRQITELQETGKTNVSGMCLADIAAIAEAAGIEMLQATIDRDGNLCA